MASTAASLPGAKPLTRDVALSIGLIEWSVRKVCDLSGAML